MKCRYCGQDFSTKVWALHEKECLKKNVKNEKPKHEFVDYDNLKVDELKECLEEKGIDIPSKATKPVLIELLQKAEEEKAESGE